MRHLAFIALLLCVQDRPEDFFGHKIGADRKLFAWPKIVEYLEGLEKKADNMKVLDLGQSTQGNPFKMLVFSAPENLKNLDRYRQIAKQLADPQNLSEDDARKLAAEGKVVLLVTLNIHSSEIGSSQMVVELADTLVRGNPHLKDVILLVIPSLNPDGQIMITEYYNKYVGTEFEGGPLPWLYHIYCGHDNNRDYYAMNLVESRIYSQICYKDWLPQIIVDEHQMGMTGPRMFVPPYKDPPNHNVHPLVWRQMATFGSHITQSLEESGKTGVVYGELFTGWWPGTSIMTPWWHNQVGILFELASCRIATPVYIEPNEIDSKMKMNSPSPWKGGWWRLRDIVEYELLGTLSVIETCAKYKESILLNQYRMAMDSVLKGKSEAPFAYVLPSDQNDPASLRRLVEILRLGGVKILKAGEEFSIDSMTFPDGSYVIPMAQPYRGYVKDLFEEQRYPDKDRPYDVAGWTLPYQMGVRFVEIKTPLPAIKQGKDMPNLGFPPKGGVLEVDPGSTDAFRLINRLHDNEIDVWRERETGTILFKATEDAVKCCENLYLKWNRVDRLPEMQLVKVKRPKIALFKPWNASMDEGWTRLLLERFEFDFKNVTAEEVKTLEGYDVLILPSLGTDALVDGPDPKAPFRYPPEYRAGLGKDGVESIEQFVKKGGTLVCLAQASNLPLDKWNLPVSNALKSLKQEEFYCPGSILRIKVDPSHPIGYGTKGEVAVVFNNGLAFDTRIPFGAMTRKVVASYSDRDVLMSGWLTGEDKIEQKPALVEVGWEKGRVVLFGFAPQFRAQPWGTFKLFFNSLYPE